MFKIILALLLMIVSTSVEAQFIFPSGGGGGAATSVVVGTTTITGGTTTRILYDNAGVLGEYTLTGTGTVVAMQTSPSLTTPNINVATGTSLALNGATIGTDKLAVTGTANISTSVTTPFVAASGVSFFNEIYFESSKTKQGILGDDTNTGLTFTGGGVGGRMAGLGPTSVNATTVFAFQLRSDSLFAWSSGTDTRPTVGFDTSLSRNAAGIVQFGTTAANASGGIMAATAALGGATIGTNALAVTGTANISGTTTLGSAALLFWSTDLNISRSAAGQLRIGTTAANASGFLLAYGGAFNGSDAAGIDIGYQRPSITIGSSSFIGWSNATPASAPDVVISRQAAGVTQFGTTSANAAGAWLAAKGTLTGGTLTDQAQVLAITATQPATITGTQNAIAVTVTGAGSSSQVNYAHKLLYSAGYTGTSFNAALNVVNTNAGSLSSGLFVGLADTTPSVAAAMIVDNGAVALPIFLARDNGTTVLSIANGGTLLLVAAPASDATKTTATLCRDTTSGEVYVGSGTVGICLGTSSLRFKNNIVDIKEGLSEIEQLQPKRFWYNKDAGDNGAKEQVGFLAEDVAQVLPNLVGLDAEGRPNTLDMIGMIPMIIKAIQELKADNDNLRAIITRRAANGG